MPPRGYPIGVRSGGMDLEDDPAWVRACERWMPHATIWLFTLSIPFRHCHKRSPSPAVRHHVRSVDRHLPHPRFREHRPVRDLAVIGHVAKDGDYYDVTPAGEASSFPGGNGPEHSVCRHRPGMTRKAACWPSRFLCLSRRDQTIRAVVKRRSIKVPTESASKHYSDGAVHAPSYDRVFQLLADPVRDHSPLHPRPNRPVNSVCDGSMIWELCSPVYDVVWRGMISSRSRRLS